MKKQTLYIAMALALAVSGCKDKPKEIPAIARAEAAQYVGEAEFAMQIRDYARAEGLFARAVELDSEQPRYWLHLGSARKHLNNISGARKAYERARELLQLQYRGDKSSPVPLFAEIQVCILLGKPDDAKNVYDRIVRDHGAEAEVKDFVERRLFDELVTDTNLKAMSL